MNKKLEERARRDFPEYFTEDISLIKSNGGTVRPECREIGYGKGSFQMMQAHTKRAGFRYCMTIPVAPQLLHLGRKFGYTQLAQAFYDEEGEEYYLNPDERAKKKHLLEQFKDMRP